MRPPVLAVAGLGASVLAAVTLLAKCPTEPMPSQTVVASASALPAPPPACAVTRPALAIRNTPVTMLCDDVYAEGGLSPADLDALREAWRSGVQGRNEAFETIRSKPVVVFCRSAACKRAFGAAPQAAAANDLGFASADVVLEDGTHLPSSVVVTGPVALTPRILTHELVHAEMRAWVEYDLLPTWFNEGTATFFAGEPRCGEEPAPDEVDVRPLVNKAEWQRHLREVGRTHDTYCASKREVGRWMGRFPDAHARAAALRGLLQTVAAGTSFDAAFAAGLAGKDPR